MEEVEDKIKIIHSGSVDTFSAVVVTICFSIGLLHLLMMFFLGFHKFPMTAVMLGHGVCIFYVALWRLCMFVSAQFNDFWGYALISWCYGWKTGEIWALGMANTLNAIMSLAYFRLMRKAWFRDLRLYHIGKDAVAWFIFVLLLIFCTAATVLSMSYAGAFLVDNSNCLAVGSGEKRDMLSALWLALCVCLPSLVAVSFFFAGTTYLTLLNNRSKDSVLRIGSSSPTESVLAHLKTIQIALKYKILSWFCTNFVDIFWLIYYPLSNNSFTDGEFYLASAQLVTLQNLTDFMVNLNFFILPRMGYRNGIRELLRRCCTSEGTISEGPVSAESESRSTSKTRYTKTIILRESVSSLEVELNESLLQTKSDFL